jgi:hypothetical protein
MRSRWALPEDNDDESSSEEESADDEEEAGPSPAPPITKIKISLKANDKSLVCHVRTVHRHRSSCHPRPPAPAPSAAPPSVAPRRTRSVPCQLHLSAGHPSLMFVPQPIVIFISATADAWGRRPGRGDSGNHSPDCPLMPGHRAGTQTPACCPASRRLLGSVSW